MASSSNNSQAKTLILRFQFDEKVYPGVTIKDTEDIKLIWDKEDKSAVTGFEIIIKEPNEEKITYATEVCC
jgi:hypothetical protein